MRNSRELELPPAGVSNFDRAEPTGYWLGKHVLKF